MHDIKAIRENPEQYDLLWAKRGLEPLSQKILDQDGLIRKAMQVMQEAEAARNKSVSYTHLTLPTIYSV